MIFATNLPPKPIYLLRIRGFSQTWSSEMHQITLVSFPFVNKNGFLGNMPWFFSFYAAFFFFLANTPHVNQQRSNRLNRSLLFFSLVHVDKAVCWNSASTCCCFIINRECSLESLGPNWGETYHKPWCVCDKTLRNNPWKCVRQRLFSVFKAVV